MLDTLSAYIQGEKTGSIAIKDKKGKMALSGNFVEGIMNGEWKHYGFQNHEYYDIRIVINHYKMGQLEGEQQSFYDTKHIKAKNYYKNGRLQGVATTYHGNGKVASLKYYEKGVAIGEEKNYAENGNIFYSLKYEKGKITYNTVYFPQIAGQIRSIYDYTTKNDSIGICNLTECTEKGFLKKILSTESKEVNGKHIGTYYEGLFEIYYDNNEQIKETGFYHIGKKVGIWTKFDINENIIEKKDYENIK